MVEAECVDAADVWLGWVEEEDGGAAATGALDGAAAVGGGGGDELVGGCVGDGLVEGEEGEEGRKTKGMVPSRPVVLVLRWGMEREVRCGVRKVDVQPAPRIRRVVGGGVEGIMGREGGGCGEGRQGNGGREWGERGWEGMVV